MTYTEKEKAYKKFSKDELIKKLIDTEMRLTLAEDCIIELNQKYDLIEKEQEKMTKDVSTFRKGTDCLTFHEHLFSLFLEELDKKNVNLVEEIEQDIKVTVQITVVKE